MNVHDTWRDRLSEYIDGDLGTAERAALERHLAGCDECRSTLRELREIVALARDLEDRPPPRDLWAGIQERIQAADDVAPRRFAFTIPRLAAAGIALALITGSAVWFLGPAPGDGGGAGLAGAESPGIDAAHAHSPDAIHLASDLAGGQYDAAIAELEHALAEGRQYLAPATVEVLEENLAIIDRAIDEARRALAEDPANVHLTSYLTDTMRRKLELLRYTNRIVQAQS